MRISNNNTTISREKIQRILDSPIPYRNDEEEELAQTLVSKLSEGELELAAQGSYAYWIATISEKPPTEKERLRMATREARRFLGSPTLEVAEALLKETCAYRVERRIDLIRACFMEGIDFDTEDDEVQVQMMQSHITNDLAKQSAYVRGCDKDGRALLILHPRTSADTEDDEFILAQIYLMERAIAATEWESEGKIEKITGVFDFMTFQSSLAPAYSAVKAVCSILQNRYSERLQKLIIIDPPFWMRTSFGLLKPFLDPVTSAKFIMASGEKGKQQIIAEVVDEEQAMPFLLPTGKLTDEVDNNVFIEKVPFHCGYDACFRECPSMNHTDTLCSGSLDEGSAEISITVG